MTRGNAGRCVLDACKEGRVAHAGSLRRHHAAGTPPSVDNRHRAIGGGEAAFRAESLTRCSREGDGRHLARVLAFVWRYTAEIDWSTVAFARRQLEATNALLDPDDPEYRGERLRLPSETQFVLAPTMNGAAKASNIADVPAGLSSQVRPRLRPSVRAVTRERGADPTRKLPASRRYRGPESW